MRTGTYGWRTLLLVCAGLFAGTAFCMKWMEGDLVQGGSPFTIIGLELTYPKEEVMRIFLGLDERVRTIAEYHLYFDFVFMIGVYPGIAALCMIARSKVTGVYLRRLLVVLALLQAVAWGCDIAENFFLLQWIQAPVIGDEFGTYHLVVYVKWVIALVGALVGGVLAAVLRKRG